MIPTSGDPGLIGATGEVFEHAYHATLGNQLPVVVKLLEDLDTPLSYLLSDPCLDRVRRGRYGDPCSRRLRSSASACRCTGLL